jgi:FlaA1/EpsC-like NDP-sugar epimerase
MRHLVAIRLRYLRGLENSFEHAVLLGAGSKMGSCCCAEQAQLRPRRIKFIEHGERRSSIRADYANKQQTKFMVNLG